MRWCSGTVQPNSARPYFTKRKRRKRQLGHITRRRTNVILFECSNHYGFHSAFFALLTRNEGLVNIMYKPPQFEFVTRLYSITDLRDILCVVYNNVRQNMSESQRRQNEYYDWLTSGQRFKVQQKVWLFTPPTAKNQPA